jgi:putative Mn2+ efflux pump MntP
MPFYEVLLIACSMAMDAFAVCLVAGSMGQVTSARPVFRLSFHFGLFQFIMPVVGWFAGHTVEPVIRNYDHWVAFGLLAYVGAHMIYEAVQAEKTARADPSRGWTLVALSVAVSIDALAVGLSLGVLGLSVWYPAFVIGLVTGILSLVALRLGRDFGGRLGRPVEIIGGLVLIGLGLRILLSHLF